MQKLKLSDEMISTDCAKYDNIILVKDLHIALTSGCVYLISQGHYRRYNNFLMNTEDVATSNFEGAQLDNEDYFEQVDMVNSISRDNQCLFMIESSWLEMYMSMENVEYSFKDPIYELYMYHGYQSKLGLNMQT